MGDATLYPHGQPSYRTDPTAADPIESRPAPAACGGYSIGGAAAAPRAEVQYWKIRVQGEAPGGSIARVEVLTGALVAN